MPKLKAVSLLNPSFSRAACNPSWVRELPSISHSRSPFGQPLDEALFADGVFRISHLRPPSLDQSGQAEFFSEASPVDASVRRAIRRKIPLFFSLADSRRVKKRADFRRIARRTLASSGLAFLALQLGLAGLIEAWWPQVRDPEYAVREKRLVERLAESNGERLWLMLGSSRTQLGLQAARLDEGAGPEEADRLQLRHAGLRPDDATDLFRSSARRGKPAPSCC